MKRSFKFNWYVYVYILISFFLSFPLSRCIVEYVNAHPNSFIKKVLHFLYFFSRYWSAPFNQSYIECESMFFSFVFFGLIGWLIVKIFKIKAMDNSK